jgi:hypothetical protein
MRANRHRENLVFKQQARGSRRTCRIKAQVLDVYACLEKRGGRRRINDVVLLYE